MGSKAALQVLTEPKGAVYIDGEHVGDTPLLLEELSAREVEIVIKPNDSTLPPFQTRLSLTPQVKTIVRHNFSNSVASSLTEIISFEKEAKNKAWVTIVTKPAQAVISVDTQTLASAPIRREMSPVVHTIGFSLPEYVPHEVTIQPILGYNLTLYVELARQQTPQAPAPSPTETLGEYKSKAVVAVYREPSFGSYTIGQIKPNQIVQVLTENENHEWLKIVVDTSITGWVRKNLLERYSPVVDEENN